MDLPPLLITIARQTALTALLLGTMVAIERLVPLGDGYSLRSRLRGALFYLGNGVAAVIVVGWMHEVWGSLGVHPLAVLRPDRWFAFAGPFAVVLVSLFVLMLTDFFGYWFHRLQHGPLWPVHAVHHSVEDLHAAGSYTHPADPPLEFLFMTIPMSMIPAITGVEVAVAGVMLTLWQFYIHSPTRFHLGPLRYLVTDNRYHRIHHSTDPRHFNRNYGTTFTIWDQLFGTAYFPRPDEWPDTGLEGLPEPRSFRDYLLFPLAVMRRPAGGETVPAPRIADA
jgi:sterol desaturase/sphingolipid hydroxylase (fatty acid hydroxylase superfamily)